MFHSLPSTIRVGLLMALGLLVTGVLLVSTTLALQPVNTSLEGPLAWSQGTGLQPARHGLGAAWVSLDGGGYYVAGGVDQDGTALSLLQRYDLASNTWITLTDLPQAVSQAAVVGNGGHLHVFGGLNADGQPSTGHDAYSVGTQTWGVRAPYPAARSGIMATALRGQIFAAGGFDADGSASGQAWRYDPVTDSWTPIDSLIHPTGLGGMAAADGYVFLVGGLRDNGPTADFVRFDPRFNVWFQGPPLPQGGRVAPAVIAAGGYLYVLGGGGLLGDPALPWPSAWRYQMARYPVAQWESVDTHSLYPLIAAAGACADDRLWVVGGVDVDGEASSRNHYLSLDGTSCLPGRGPLYLPILQVLSGQDILHGGSWAGSTQYGDPFGFELDIARSILVTGTLGGRFYLDTCQQAGPVTFDFSVPNPVPVDLLDRTFSYGDGFLRLITGTFTSPTTAQGFYSLGAILVPGHEFCFGSGTWQASWQGR